MISGNMVGSYSQIGKTFILVDEDGNEITGVCVDNPVIFTAGDNDVREGMVYASDNGVSMGTKDIPAYHTSQGSYMVFDGDTFMLDHLGNKNRYDYTQLQCVIAPFNHSVAKSVAADKIVLNNNVYLTNSTDSLALITKDKQNKIINFNVQNNSGQDYVIHYFTYKEES